MICIERQKMATNEREKAFGIKQHNLRFLWAAGNLYSERNSHLSKYLISKFHRTSSLNTKVDGRDASSLYCTHCFNLHRPGNYSARLAQRLRLSRHIAKSKMKAAVQGLTSLTKQKASQLKRWENSQTKLIFKCKACNSTAKTSASKRRISQSNLVGRKTLVAKRRLRRQETKQAKRQGARTPVSNVESRDFTSKQTQQSRKSSFPLTTPSTQGQRASPCFTPSGTLSVSARKVRSLNKQKHKQLQRMLDGAKKEKANSQSPLNDFLVSL